jgi:hypothetical protein
MKNPEEIPEGRWRSVFVLDGEEIGTDWQEIGMVNRRISARVCGLRFLKKSKSRSKITSRKRIKSKSQMKSRKERWRLVLLLLLIRLLILFLILVLLLLFFCAELGVGDVALHQMFKSRQASAYPGAGSPYSLAVTRARAASSRHRKAGRIVANSSDTVR